MKILSDKRCIIGEGPIWNEKERALYFTNGFGREICRLKCSDGGFEELETFSLARDHAAFAFDVYGRMIASSDDGVFYLDIVTGAATPLYDETKIAIKHANDMKAGPDGRLYVGTQSSARLGISEDTDGRLFSIDARGNVKLLLDGLRLSNGMEWSADQKRFYHTDSDTGLIKEYDFDAENGEIDFTGRELSLPGVDGFTVDICDNIYAPRWGYGELAVIDAESMSVKDRIALPCSCPSSCGFAGKNMDILAVTTASYGTNVEKDKNAGYTVLLKTGTRGRKPFLFGKML